MAQRVLKVILGILAVSGLDPAVAVRRLSGWLGLSAGPRLATMFVAQHVPPFCLPAPSALSLFVGFLPLWHPPGAVSLILALIALFIAEGISQIVHSQLSRRVYRIVGDASWQVVSLI